jgi:hypothetical protein
MKESGLNVNAKDQYIVKLIQRKNLVEISQSLFQSVLMNPKIFNQRQVL